MTETEKYLTSLPEPPVSKIIFADTRIASLWLLARLYVGWLWLEAGWHKVTSPDWVGPQAGSVVSAFLKGALNKSTGEHPDVQQWYATLVSHYGLDHAVLISYIVSYGELIVGILLILGLLTGIAAFTGTFMNLNYLFAGTVSLNPIMLLLQLLLILAWRVAGWYGLDRWALPALGTPWRGGTLTRWKSSS